MRLHMNRALILSLILTGVFVGCASFPRTAVSTDEQDVTIAIHDTSVDFSPMSIGTVHLNRTIHFLDSTTTSSGIRDTNALFSNLRQNLEDFGYTVIDTVLTMDEIDTATLTGIKLINISESVNEFTMYYYYSYWGGWYYPPYYGGWYSYSFTIGSIVFGMLDCDIDKELWTGVISGFTDKTVPQTTRITNGTNELFTIPPYQALN